MLVQRADGVIAFFRDAGHLQVEQAILPDQVAGGIQEQLFALCDFAYTAFLGPQNPAPNESGADFELDSKFEQVNSVASHNDIFINKINYLKDNFLAPPEEHLYPTVLFRSLNEACVRFVTSRGTAGVIRAAAGGGRLQLGDQRLLSRCSTRKE
ncbi:MAG: hypothetical protein ACHQIO_11120 [Nevskiales bacterium]